MHRSRVCSTSCLSCYNTLFNASNIPDLCQNIINHVCNTFKIQLEGFLYTGSLNLVSLVAEQGLL